MNEGCETVKKPKNKIKELRVGLGLRQDELAQVAKISNQALSNIENGKSLPKGLTMLKLAKVLDEDPRKIFFRDFVGL